MTIDLRVWADIDVPDLPEVSEEMVIRLLRSAVRMGGELVRQTWERRAIDLRIRHSGSYLRGIRSGARIEVEREEQTGEDTWEIVVAVTNTSPHASIVEDGHVAFHLPAKIDWNSASGSIKRTAAGKPYLVVPFRHAAFVPEGERGASGMTTAARKAMLPREVYAEARRMEFSKPTRSGPIFEARQAPAGGLHGPAGPIRAGAGYQQFVAADRYRWAQGSRGVLSRPEAFHRPGQVIGGREPWIETRGPRGLNPAWKGSKFEGMRRMGEPGHTQYLTWRVVTPDSQGWHIPARAGHHVAAQVAAIVPDVVGPFIEETFGHLLAERGLA